MELKTYQKQVIADLSHYLDILNQTKSYPYAFQCFWMEKSAPALGRYKDILPGVPTCALKSPLAAAKHFLPAILSGPFSMLCL